MKTEKILGERIKKVREKLAKDENTAIIITEQCNIRYLTGFKTSNGMVFISRETSKFFTDFRYIEAATASAGCAYDVSLFPAGENFWKDLLNAEGITKVMYEENYITLKMKLRYDKLFGAEKLIASGGLLEGLRAVKDESEIAAIKEAQRITDRAFSYILDFISDNMGKITETDTAAELEYKMRLLGADGKAFDTIAVSGIKSSRPHGEPENIPLKKGFLTMDFGAMYGGYCSDMTRTVCLGAPDGEMKKIYGIVLSAQSAALEFIHAGISGVDADNSARKIIAEAGYGEFFGHSLGHSLGLEIHETPCFSLKDGSIILENMVITVEPGIYISGKYGVRIEDLAVILPNGVENLTKSEKKLLII